MSYLALGQSAPMVDAGWYYIFSKLPVGWNPVGWYWGRSSACATAQSVWPDVRVAVWGNSEQAWIHNGLGAGCH